jgi:hypothetical protein
LGGDVADVFAANEVVGDAPSQGPKGKEGEQKGRQSEGARAAAAGLLILDDAKRGHDDATSTFSDRTVTASLFAREGGEQIAFGGGGTRSGTLSGARSRVGGIVAGQFSRSHTAS